MSFNIKNNWFITLSAFSIAIGIIMGTGSLYRFIYNYNMIMAVTLFFMTIVIFYQFFIPISIKNNTVFLNTRISIPSIFLITLMIFVTLLTDIINLVSSYEIIYFYIFMIILSLLLTHDFREKILNAYLIIIIILSILSIITLYLAIFTEYLSFFPYIKVYRPIATNFYFFSSVSPYTIWLRNASIFWEPGAFGFHLIFATLLAYRINNKIFIIILVTTCVTTFSTTVFIFLILLCIYHIFYTKTRIKTLIIIFSVAIITFSFFFVAIGDLLIPKLILRTLVDKFSPSSSAYKSFIERTLFTTAAFHMFLDNFILGTGHYATAEKLEVVLNRSTVNTSGLAGLLAEFGLFGAFNIFLFVRYFGRFSLIAIPITLIWLNGEFLQYSPLALFILVDSADEFANNIFPKKVNILPNTY